MADWDEPTLTSTYVNVLANLKSRDTDAASLNESPTNPFTGQLRYNRTSNKFQEWDGSSWSDKVISLAGGGTGGTDAASARTGLGLGSMSTQNSNAVTITGGTVSGLTSLGVSGNFTLSGILTAGSGPTTITTSAGLVQRSAIENNANIADINAAETVSGAWNFTTPPTLVATNVTGILESAILDGSILARLGSNETVTGNWIFSGTVNLNGVVDIAGGLIAGSGNVGIIDSTGKIPAISSTYFASLSGANLTGIPETAISDGSILARVASNETITGIWTFNSSLTTLGAINSSTSQILSTLPIITMRDSDGGVNAKNWLHLVINEAYHLRAYDDATSSSNPAFVINRSGITVTDFSLYAPLRASNGSDSAPSISLQSATTSGIYYNSAGSTVEFGARFNNAARSVMRAYANQAKIDFLLAATVALELSATDAVFPGGVSGSAFAGDTVQTDNLLPLTASATTIGIDDPNGRFDNIYLVNAPNVSSDIRHKEVLGTLEGSLDIVNSIEPFKFKWKHGDDPRIRPGFSAQDIGNKLDTIFHTTVCNKDIFDIHSLYQEELIPVLWQAVRELYDIVQSRS